MSSYSVAEPIYDLAEGQYEAVIQSIEPAIVDPNKPRDPRFDKPQLVFTYLLTEIEREDGSPITRREYVNDVGQLTPKATLYARFSTLLNEGKPLGRDQNYSTEDLLNRSCQIFWGSYMGEDGTTKMKVKAVSPPKAAAAAASCGVRRKAAAGPEDATDLNAAIDSI